MELLNYLFEGFNSLLKPKSFGFMNEKLPKIPDKKEPIEQVYLNNMRLLCSSARDEKNDERRTGKISRKLWCH